MTAAAWCLAGVGLLVAVGGAFLSYRDRPFDGGAFADPVLTGWRKFVKGRSTLYVTIVGALLGFAGTVVGILAS